MRYTLLLDESGQFIERDNNTEPAIIAGYLVAGIDVSEQWAERQLAAVKRHDSAFAAVDIEHFHAMENINDITCQYITALLGLLAERQTRFIVFQNERGRNVYNSDVTYLNVFAEGIVTLIRNLLVENSGEERISLDIIYAGRNDMAAFSETGERVYLDKDEYVKRLKEKIDLSFAKLAQADKKRFTYSLTMKNARTYKPLMLADAICFAFRGGKQRFSAELQGRIDALDKTVFCVNNSEKWELINDYLIANRAADAIYLWYTNYDDKELMSQKERFETNIAKVLKNIDFKGRKLQYNILSFMIGALIEGRNFEVVDKFLDNLVYDFFEVLDEHALTSYELYFDIKFWRLTSATHQGNTAVSDRYISECRDILKKLVITAENLDYYILYKIREIEHLKNIFAFDEAISELDKLEKIQMNLVHVLAQVNESEHGGVNIQSDTLAKIWGSRAITRAYFVKNQPSCYRDGIVDSDNAIEQFTTDSDRGRQYQVRAYLETEAGQYENAYRALLKAFKLEETEESGLLVAIWGNPDQERPNNIFGLMHYTNLMAKAAASDALGLKTMAYRMFDVLKEYQDRIKQLSPMYPNFIVQWRIATYLAMLGKDGADDFYDIAKAGLSCNQTDLTNYTSYAVMLTERLHLLQPIDGKFEQCIAELQDALKIIQQKETPKEMRAYFIGWDIEKIRKAFHRDATSTKEKNEMIAKYKAVPIL